MARRVSLALLWGIVIGCSQSPPEDASADSLLSQMRSGDAHARGSAAKVLSTLRDERTVEPLIAIFQDTGCAPEVRVTAAQVLAQIGDGRAVQPLIVALMDEDRTFVALLLVRLKGCNPSPIAVRATRGTCLLNVALLTVLAWAKRP